MIQRGVASVKCKPASPRKGIIARYVVIGLCCVLAALAAPFLVLAHSDWSKARDQAALEQRYGRLADDPDIVKQVEAIETESVASSAPPWAGRYYMGDGLGMNITLYVAPKSGVVATNFSDGGGFDADAGIVEVRPDGSLHFTFKHPRESVLLYRDFVPVRWGERRYLIGSAEMAEFVHRINRNEAIGGMVRWLLSDQYKPVEGLPTLPPSYAGWIRDRPATVSVLMIHRGEDPPEREPPFFACAMWQASVAVDKADGLHPGEVLEPKGRDWSSIELVIDGVKGDRASARILKSFPCSSSEQSPDTGSIFTTGAYDAVATHRLVTDAIAREEAYERDVAERCTRHWYRLWLRSDDCLPWQ